MTQAKPRFRTFEEYLDYDDGIERRYELVNGEIVKLPAESDLNVQIAIFLTVMFAQQVPYYLIRRGTEIFVKNRSITSRFPDLVVLSEDGDAALKSAKRSAITYEMPTPLLVIKVVSPGDDNYERDYVTKRNEYADRAIPEYWLIDPAQNSVIILSLDDKHYSEVGEFKNNDRILSPTFPDLH